MAKKITLKKLDEILTKGCKDALKDFFDEGITTMRKPDGTIEGHRYQQDIRGIGRIITERFANFKSKQFKKVSSEYYALLGGPCGKLVGTKEEKLRYKKDLERILGSV
jgi:hypothetical protein